MDNSVTERIIKTRNMRKLSKCSAVYQKPNDIHEGVSMWEVVTVQFGLRFEAENLFLGQKSLPLNNLQYLACLLFSN